MTQAEAAETLIAVIEAENAALHAHDVAAAAALLDRKQQAASALARPGAPPAPATLHRLQQAAAANEALLSHAMAVQSRILAMVTAAARRTTRAATFYRPDGRPGPGGRTVLPAVRA